MGYVRTGSIPSVAAGLTVGSLYLLGGYRIQSRQSYGVEYVFGSQFILPNPPLFRSLYYFLQTGSSGIHRSRGFFYSKSNSQSKAIASRLESPRLVRTFHFRQCVQSAKVTMEPVGSVPKIDRME